MKTYGNYIVMAYGHRIRVTHREQCAAVKLADRCSVPIEDLLVFLNVPDCAIVMPSAALKLLEGLDLKVAALDDDNEGRLSLVRQTRFRNVSAERLMAQSQRHGACEEIDL